MRTAETIINKVKYIYSNAPAFGPKIMSYVDCGGPNGSENWVNDTEMNLIEPIETFEQFEKIAKEIDERYN